MAFEFAFEDLPPEVQEQIKNQQVMAEMSTENYSTAVFNLFDELSSDQLQTLNTMFYNIVISPRGQLLAAHYQGQVQMANKFKYNICPLHGVNHDKEIPGQGPDDQVPPEPTPEAPAGTWEPSQDDKINMSVYGLSFKISEETHLPLFYCVNCSMSYPSIQDRMLKDSDNCPGCIQKAQWG